MGALFQVTSVSGGIDTYFGEIYTNMLYGNLPDGDIGSSKNLIGNITLPTLFVNNKKRFRLSPVNVWYILS